jgi:hypothetical protein
MEKIMKDQNNKTEEYIQIGTAFGIGNCPDEPQNPYDIVTFKDEASDYGVRLIIKADLSEKDLYDALSVLQFCADNELCGRCIKIDEFHHHPLCDVEQIPDKVVKAISLWDDAPEDILKALSKLADKAL